MFLELQTTKEKMRLPTLTCVRKVIGWTGVFMVTASLLSYPFAMVLFGRTGGAYVSGMGLVGITVFSLIGDPYDKKEKSS